MPGLSYSLEINANNITLTCIDICLHLHTLQLLLLYESRIFPSRIAIKCLPQILFRGRELTSNQKAFANAFHLLEQFICVPCNYEFILVSIFKVDYK